ncbi:MAG: bifunctional phosphopantothenoylcysteine decarboxylase/phosphopantothenate--cysteine ligase CoaBC [[Lactobacillus] timonensis]|jgi:phosphopantothenoylcysteine decarboxylase/phosphopantothenate--cysteine ligase|nr:bifunctional phosphopantothenoylcysteine decarboxylase/phosphopantothenate--cysteine ligase CoaBC [[Lactobacillus] timonensis]MCI1926013.1 bifunctional phosphopantothenoylcysteine decarboxylase/phosphopantothenate--cysteine ligase CoaBC [[Lactobacillus] timonensis]MCI1957377.1 bifunctional phosphopantothenoylcysteine decarboxylase/phosphopantothenate--cysteine ligase CoaBC [[Lactobacillus] timonensis]MCI1970475.1 bifunctional phosphopantothenoylcysteine decarboxylase/phosphopantothenate--cyst
MVKHVAVYVTGSIAAYKAVELVRALQKKGLTVRVAETKAATKLVGPVTFASLTKYSVLVDLWDESAEGHVPHIELADWADLAVVVPATANVISKMANGIADDAVTAALLATSAPIAIIPAMNSHMWGNPATQRNINVLKQDGRLLMEPATGYLAEGYQGKGRLPAISAIANFVETVLIADDDQLSKRKVVVTLGGTREPLDPVRFLGNRSSGKMGVAIARAALNAGATVTIIAGSVQVQLPQSPHCQIIKVTTTEEMATAVNQELNDADVLVMAAAVADFKLASPAQQKIKKAAGRSNYQLTLVPTIDILKSAGQRKRPGQLVVGFAAETNDLIANAQKKLANKNADVIVANDVGGLHGAFGSEDNRVTILQPNQDPDKWPLMSKKAVGKRLVGLIAQLLRKEN